MKQCKWVGGVIYLDSAGDILEKRKEKMFLKCKSCEKFIEGKLIYQLFMYSYMNINI